MDDMIDPNVLYPLTFEPRYKEVMWGGKKLTTKLGRILPESAMPIGEAWEICDRPDAVSVIDSGPLKGKTLREIMACCPRSLVGRDFHGERFPLLVKLIDAGKRLSLQVHPDREVAEQLGGEPKTEMWYVIDADKHAKIFAGLSRLCTRAAFMDFIGAREAESMLQVFQSRAGDAYFITAGTIHAIDAGNLLLEIQQNSDTTYRVSDWGRTGPGGVPRPLHVQEALQSIDFYNRTSPKISGPVGKSYNNRKFPIVNQCPYFLVDDLKLIESWQDCAEGASFHLLTAVDHPVNIVGENQTTRLEIGRTCLIPACYGNYRIDPPENEETTIIKTTL